ncbi:pentatricopeptide repeat-containing protein At3g58590 [Punica granatum]|uniref:Pentatricopeptide repeat-containing protein At3g58590 n=1 Tax=Punica granatum TaxID=22663 RepID=A0A218X173_PUNGR|nr:pentatricopeptide repeat-containing protein At3g58590 [Punica granatum]OWM78694.1 hypothetical protein CDL15_Pgr002865 [Punica granatum]
MSFNGASASFNRHPRRVLRLLRGCTELRSVDATECLHAVVITMGSYAVQPIFLNNNLVSLYAAAGELATARKVFDRMHERNTVSYNTLIGAYSRRSHLKESWSIFSEMVGLGFEPTQHSVTGLLSAPSAGICLGAQLQAMVMKSGLFYANAFVGTALLNLNGRNGYLDEAVRVFEDMPRKSMVTWNSMLTLLGQNGFSGLCGHLFCELTRKDAGLSECSLIGVLSGCIDGQDLGLGEQVHGLVLKNGYYSEASVVNSLISMYAKCLGPSFAEKAFEELRARDVVSWNIIIGACAKSGKPERALQLFHRMSADGVLPNQTTFAVMVNSCIGVGLLIGEFVHAKIFKNAYVSDIFVGSALIDFYSKYDKLDAARGCFDEICEKTTVSWNALLSGYANSQSNTAPFLFLEMVEAGHQPNELTFSAVLKASSSFELQQFHCMVIKMGYESNGYVLSSLITSYARNGLISDALAFVSDSDQDLTVGPANSIAGIYSRSGQYLEAVKLLSGLEEPDLVSWNIVIAACARSHNHAEVLELFKHMHMIRIQPDKFTFVSLLTVCSRLCNLALGSSIHGLMIKLNFNQCDTMTCNILMDMYGKCGSIGSSVKIFERMTDKNIVTWTVLISGLAVNGRPLEALERFREMESLGFKSDGVLFNALLRACRHGGLVRKGMELFQLMKTHHGIEPGMDHYHCMVDLLTQSGYIREAEQMIARMPFPPHAALWRSFLEGCKRRGSAEDIELEQGKEVSV